MSTCPAARPMTSPQRGMWTTSVLGEAHVAQEVTSRVGCDWKCARASQALVSPIKSVAGQITSTADTFALPPPGVGPGDVGDRHAVGPRSARVSSAWRRRSRRPRRVRALLLNPHATGRFDGAAVRCRPSQSSSPSTTRTWGVHGRGTSLPRAVMTRSPRPSARLRLGRVGRGIRPEARRARGQSRGQGDRRAPGGPPAPLVPAGRSRPSATRSTRSISRADRQSNSAGPRVRRTRRALTSRSSDGRAGDRTSAISGGAPSMPRCADRATTTSGWTISSSARITSMGDTERHAVGRSGSGARGRGRAQSGTSCRRSCCR